MILVNELIFVNVIYYLISGVMRTHFRLESQKSAFDHYFFGLTSTHFQTGHQKFAMVDPVY
jgi:hypothetical protein